MKFNKNKLLQRQKKYLDKILPSSRPYIYAAVTSNVHGITFVKKYTYNKEGRFLSYRSSGLYGDKFRYRWPGQGFSTQRRAIQALKSTVKNLRKISSKEYVHLFSQIILPNRIYFMKKVLKRKKSKDAKINICA